MIQGATMGSARQVLGERALVALNVLAITLALFVLLGPSGAIGRWIADWKHERTEARLISAHWEGIAGAGQRIDTGEGQVRLVEFSDFQCPYCAKLRPSLDSLVQLHPLVGVVYRHLPLSGHQAARGAALSAVCGGFQGKFLVVYDRLFSTRAWETDTNWVKLASDAGSIDTTSFSECLSSPEAAQVVDADLAMAGLLGISATPTLIIENRIINGAVSVRGLEKALGLPSRSSE